MSADIELASIINLHTPLKVATERVLPKLGLEPIGGPSGNGWSSLSTFMACPYKYKMTEVGEHPTEDYLEVGGLFHELRAYTRKALLDGGSFDAQQYCSALLDERVNPTNVHEARRLFTAYSSRYENDYLSPISIEKKFVIDKLGHTCRYDEIAVATSNSDGFPEGAWIVECKTASRRRDHWDNDGEILGEMLGWKYNRLDAKYGKLNGVLIDLVVKTRVPEFHRIAVPVNLRRLAMHARDLAAAEMEREACKAKNVWPRRRNSCLAHYKPCTFYDHCAG